MNNPTLEAYVERMGTNVDDDAADAVVELTEEDRFEALKRLSPQDFLRLWPGSTLHRGESLRETSDRIVGPLRRAMERKGAQAGKLFTREVQQLDPWSLRVIRVWPSAVAASEGLGIKLSQVSLALNGGAKCVGGYGFSFVGT